MQKSGIDMKENAAPSIAGGSPLRRETSFSFGRKIISFTPEFISPLLLRSPHPTLAQSPRYGQWLLFCEMFERKGRRSANLTEQKIFFASLLSSQKPSPQRITTAQLNLISQEMKINGILAGFLPINLYTVQAHLLPATAAFETYLVKVLLLRKLIYR